MSSLSVSQLSKEFTGASGTLKILDGLDLELDRGEAVAITGPSGSGKSTLLYIVGTLDTPTSGSVTIDGEDPFSRSPAQMATFRNRHVGFVFQDHHLLPQCTVLENILVPALAGDGANQEAEARARSLLERVDLAERIDHRPAQLSGGERQRVAVCRALINQPSLLLADEPTGNLDRTTAESVGTMLLEIGQEQGTVMICVTHSTELASRFPRHFELLDGRLAEQAATSAQAGS